MGDEEEKGRVPQVKDGGSINKIVDKLNELDGNW